MFDRTIHVVTVKGFNLKVFLTILAFIVSRISYQLGLFSKIIKTLIWIILFMNISFNRFENN